MLATIIILHINSLFFLFSYLRGSSHIFRTGRFEYNVKINSTIKTRTPVQNSKRKTTKKRTLPTKTTASSPQKGRFSQGYIDSFIENTDKKQV